MSRKILIIYYSVHGSTAKLADYIARGVGMVDNCQAIVRTVPRVSSNCEATEKAIPDSGAPYATIADLQQCDGLILGSPTRFGNMSAALKYFIDSTASIWMNGELSGKPAAVFTSTTSMHGGQESTLLSMMLPLLHHGMILVGLPYSHPELTSTTAGGSPYGATHVCGADNVREINDTEAILAKALGKRVAEISTKITGIN